MAHETERKALVRYLETHNLKRTKQREVILEAFLEAKGHISAEELHQRIRDQEPQIGYTTVYRTMKLLVEAGLAEERHFDGGVALYEVESDHHDHLVCVDCGKIVEFESTVIEAMQREIAAEHGFQVVRHRHELYGHCRDCRKE